MNLQPSFISNFLESHAIITIIFILTIVLASAMIIPPYLAITAIIFHTARSILHLENVQNASTITILQILKKDASGVVISIQIVLFVMIINVSRAINPDWRNSIVLVNNVFVSIIALA